MELILTSCFIFAFAIMSLIMIINTKSYQLSLILIVFLAIGTNELIRGINKVKNKKDYNNLISGKGGFSTTAKFIKIVNSKTINGCRMHTISYEYKDENNKKHRTITDFIEENKVKELENKKVFPIKCFKSASIIVD